MIYRSGWTVYENGGVLFHLLDPNEYHIASCDRLIALVQPKPAVLSNRAGAVSRMVFDAVEKLEPGQMVRAADFPDVTPIRHVNNALNYLCKRKLIRRQSYGCYTKLSRQEPTGS